jgi:hypothetical protein
MSTQQRTRCRTVAHLASHRPCSPACPGWRWGRPAVAWPAPISRPAPRVKGFVDSRKRTRAISPAFVQGSCLRCVGELPHCCCRCVRLVRCLRCVGELPPGHDGERTAGANRLSSLRWPLGRTALPAGSPTADPSTLDLHPLLGGSLPGWVFLRWHGAGPFARWWFVAGDTPWWGLGVGG